ncbi:hypothetical protein, partial [Alistipes finegoldii]|uniref:hypothetical protein n=1 Tax=Alistipes finegoldii TaxID=214856 RepID=UPI00272FDB9E
KTIADPSGRDDAAVTGKALPADLFEGAYLGVFEGAYLGGIWGRSLLACWGTRLPDLANMA